MEAIFKTNDDKAIFIVRVVLGFVIFAYGAQKLLGWFGGHGVTDTITMWNQWWGIPAVLTFLVIVTESAGAIALIIGMAGRIMAVSIGLVMLGAIYLVHMRWGFHMNWYAQAQTGEGFEYHLLILAMVTAIIIKGSGSWSFDRWLCNKYFLK